MSERPNNVETEDPDALSPRTERALRVASSVSIGANVTFSVGAAGYPAPTFQWRLNDCFRQQRFPELRFLDRFHVIPPLMLGFGLYFPAMKPRLYEF